MEWAIDIKRVSPTGEPVIFGTEPMYEKERAIEVIKKVFPNFELNFIYGEVSLKVYNPKTDGGQRGYCVTKGWSMQTIIPQGTTLRFFDYHSPKGYTEKDGDKMYGERVVSTVTDEKVVQRFKEADKELLEYMKNL